MNRYKVIKDKVETIVLGKYDGGVLEVKRDFFDFLPEVGEEVEVYSFGNEYIINRLEIRKTKNESSNTSVLKIFGWVCVAGSMILFPIILGPLGLILGYLVRSKGEKEHGTVMMIAAVATMILGFLLGYITSYITF